MSKISRVIKSVNEFNATNPGVEAIGAFLQKLLKVNLWGNRNDLSITLGKEIEQSAADPLDEVETFNRELLVDQTKDIWDCLNDGKTDKIVDIINDNSGYELLCDLVLADFIIQHNLATKIRFRVKTIPWFISDVLPADFKFTISELAQHKDEILSGAGTKWENFINNGQFELIEPADHFFTSPYEFFKMEQIAPALFQSIAESHLAIFKGDLK